MKSLSTVRSEIFLFKALEAGEEPSGLCLDWAFSWDFVFVSWHWRRATVETLSLGQYGIPR